MQSVITGSTHHKNKVENSACINGESNINTTFLPPDSPPLTSYVSGSL